MTDLAIDIKLFIEEKIKTEKFYLIGHSMGGGVAMQLALLMPENIKRLILVAPIDTS